MPPLALPAVLPADVPGLTPKVVDENVFVVLLLVDMAVVLGGVYVWARRQGARQAAAPVLDAALPAPLDAKLLGSVLATLVLGGGGMAGLVGLLWPVWPDAGAVLLAVGIPFAVVPVIAVATVLTDRWGVGRLRVDDDGLRIATPDGDVLAAFRWADGPFEIVRAAAMSPGGMGGFHLVWQLRRGDDVLTLCHPMGAFLPAELRADGPLGGPAGLDLGPAGKEAFRRVAARASRVDPPLSG